MLRELNAHLGGQANVRFNAAGIAVSGDAILHADDIYISFNADGTCGLAIMYRACKGRRNYSGSVNHWFTIDRLKQTGVEGLGAAVVQRLAFEKQRRNASSC